MVINYCGVIRPLVIKIASLGVLSILAPEAFASVWPYYAAIGIPIVPVLVYQWWNPRYKPACRLKYKPQPEVSEN